MVVRAVWHADARNSGLWRGPIDHHADAEAVITTTATRYDTWRTDLPAFRAHRHYTERQIAIERAQRRGGRRSWFAALDTTIRHCRQMEALAGQEAPATHRATHSLLNAANIAARDISTTKGA